ncbi:hypothetical protein BGZ95_008714, partial [Linnemannia exigua]
NVVEENSERTHPTLWPLPVLSTKSLRRLLHPRGRQSTIWVIGVNRRPTATTPQGSENTTKQSPRDDRWSDLCQLPGIHLQTRTMFEGSPLSVELELCTAVVLLPIKNRTLSGASLIYFAVLRPRACWMS